MHHSTVASQAPHGKTFNVKGMIESSHAGELITAEEFLRLAATDVKLTRTAGGGFEYEIEFSVMDSSANRAAAFAQGASGEEEAGY